MVDGFKIMFDTLKYETADQEQRRFLNQYNRLKDEKLLYHPLVDILIDKDSVVTLLLETNHYNEIKRFRNKEVQEKSTSGRRK